MISNGHELNGAQQPSVPEAEEPKLPVYEVGQALGLLHDLTPGYKLADSLTSVTVELDPVVDRFLDAYEILRGETTVARRDRRMITMLLQGMEPAEVVKALDPADLLGGKGRPLLDPRQTVTNIRRELPDYFSRSGMYRSEYIVDMLARYIGSQDVVESIPLPTSKTQALVPLTGRPAELRPEQKVQVELWLTKGLGERLTTEQVQHLGGYLLGAAQRDEQIADARTYIEGLTDIVAVAKTQTAEFAAGRYRTREFQKRLVFDPDRAAVLVDLIAKAKSSKGPVFNASLGSYATSYHEALERIAAERAKVIQALRHVVVLASADPEQPGGEG